MWHYLNVLLPFFWSHTLVRMCCVHVSVHVCRSTLTPHIHSIHLVYFCIKSAFLYCPMYLASHPSSGHKPGLNMYIHQNMNAFPPVSPPQLWLLCIVVQKRVHPCVVLYASPTHPSSGPTPWLECEYKLVCICMST